MMVEVVGPDKIHAVDCDVFAPCALGAVINDDTIPQLKCSIVCGSANNTVWSGETATAVSMRRCRTVGSWMVTGFCAEKIPPTAAPSRVWKV